MNSKVENGISVKIVSLGLGAFGLILALVGLFMKIQNKAPDNDLEWFLLIIGIGFMAVGLLKMVRTNGQKIYTKSDAKDFFLNNVILLALILMMIVIACLETQFVQFRVLLDILTQSSTRMIIALGISFILLTGGTDLSAGRIVGLAAVVSASMMQTATYANRFFPDLPQISVVIPIVIAILVSLVFGLLNGTLVAKMGLQPFIGTLAVQVIVYGLTSIYFDLPPNRSQPIGGIRPDFSIIGQKKLLPELAGGFSVLILIALVFIALVWFLMNKTVFGKNIYAIGGNREAAKVSGVNVTRTLLIVFVLASAFYAVGGVLEAARTAGATNNYGMGYELDAIAACVVGGISLNGGVGKIRGVVMGVLIFTVINYGLSFIGLSPYWQQVIKGIIIAAAVAIDVVKYRTKS